MDAPELKDLVSRIKEQVHRAIVGMEDAIEALIVCLLAEGHLLLEGPPGLAKTYLVKSFARALDLSFSRIQFTSDLLPSARRHGPSAEEKSLPLGASCSHARRCCASSSRQAREG
jgi:MoxR-like ATPase